MSSQDCSRPLQLEHWPTSKLIAYARNPRKNDHAVDQMAAVIAEFGFRLPVVVRSTGELVDGHLRLKAAIKLGLEAIPVVLADELTDTQIRAFRLLANRSATWAEWDDDLLQLELAALNEADFDLSLTGFDADELADILSGVEVEQDGQTDDDAVPEPEARPISQVGDVWLMGKHRLVCGDATTVAAYQLLLGDGQVDMVFTDPPFNVAYGDSAMFRKRGTSRPILNDALGAGFQQFLADALALMVPRCRGAMYIAMSSSELDALQAAFRDAGGHWSTFIIWAKNRFSLGTADYQRQFEPILYGWPKGVKRHWCGDRDQSDVWQIDRRAKNDLHPTMKPVELVERAIRNSSRPGDIVLDPFAGSGTTLIAAEKVGRIARLMELDPKYADTIVRRWQDWTGKSAVREHDGVAFNEVAGTAEAEPCKAAPVD
ncbi:DNA modification methylase [Eleftheria terrae]|uniref:DNA modification methylase n=1 Tax=Eleftheria terrae TaxID=1597781 RepID=UPI00263A7152|nr:DNA modification methylase [Eleftheria terrae]WKB50794.1 DNA modification methylase [Eleftheria terrae]